METGTPQNEAPVTTPKTHHIPEGGKSILTKTIETEHPQNEALATAQKDNGRKIYFEPPLITYLRGQYLNFGTPTQLVGGLPLPLRWNL